jgi:3alpha(or 20beta)-hydroxysteroid dehydrogenase
MKRFDNRTVIVTGGARGMGASHGRGFLAEGANMVIADVLEQEGRSLADELGGHAMGPVPDSRPRAEAPAMATT